jgi:hypothetical protein
MKQTTYVKVSGLVFLIVAVAHAVRAYNGWSIMVGSMEVPTWISWVVVLFLGYMSYTALKHR